MACVARWGLEVLNARVRGPRRAGDAGRVLCVVPTLHGLLFGALQEDIVCAAFLAEAMW